MAQENSQSSIRRELEAKEDQIKRRLVALEDEIVSTPAAIKSAVMKNPLVGIGAAIAAGAMIGLIYRVRKKNRSPVPPAHEALIDRYISAVADEVSRGVRRGRDPEDVVRKSLRGRAPLIVHSPASTEPDHPDSKGILRQLADLTLKTALGFAMKAAVDLLIASVDVKKIQKAILLEKEESISGAKSPQTHAGDGFPDASAIQNEPTTTE